MLGEGFLLSRTEKACQEICMSRKSLRILYIIVGSSDLFLDVYVPLSFLILIELVV